MVFLPTNTVQGYVVCNLHHHLTLELAIGTVSNTGMVSTRGIVLDVLASISILVAERTLYLWNNEHIVNLIAQNRDVILPLIFKALEKNMRDHWNPAVHGLTANVRKMFLEMDAELFEDCQRKYLEKEARARELEEQRELTWKKLEAVAAQAVRDNMVLVN
ncbi:serine/threonine protein phosphatase 2A 57 kDa regulatory subunit B' beta isoform-like [Senna tora]|uniref:Serine/threonine protein phosphatase 2A 57 kDa regulatory subunit B' beta isoform-like n=1 Tax=Senna tora TaxID=362788 RepID=A0A834W6H7_9FABA|nr:serine/threonine protein phosphatase 2A 57 kDa regulatory subunit B' beta isoform-like [Senna tora]